MILFPMLCGGHITLMDPMAFVRRPYRWIRRLADESAHGRTFAAAPNFAFALCAERGLPPDGEALDLSNVVGLLNGSEPVTISAIEKFNTAFAPYGLPATAIKPSYGMAEATLSVASIAPEAEPTAVYLDRGALVRGRAVRVDTDAPGSVPLVSCGRPIPSQWLVIVDSTSGAELPDGTVGEIWLHGNNIGRGYWVARKRPNACSRTSSKRVWRWAATPTVSPTTEPGWRPAISGSISTGSYNHRPQQGSDHHRRSQPFTRPTWKPR